MNKKQLKKAEYQLRFRCRQEDNSESFFSHFYYLLLSSTLNNVFLHHKHLKLYTTVSIHISSGRSFQMFFLSAKTRTPLSRWLNVNVNGLNPPGASRWHLQAISRTGRHQSILICRLEPQNENDPRRFPTSLCVCLLIYLFIFLFILFRQMAIICRVIFDRDSCVTDVGRCELDRSSWHRLAQKTLIGAATSAPPLIRLTAPPVCSLLM